MGQGSGDISIPWVRGVANLLQSDRGLLCCSSCNPELKLDCLPEFYLFRAGTGTKWNRKTRSVHEAIQEWTTEQAYYLYQNTLTPVLPSLFLSTEIQEQIAKSFQEMTSIKDLLLDRPLVGTVAGISSYRFPFQQIDGRQQHPGLQKSLSAGRGETEADRGDTEAGRGETEAGRRAQPKDDFHGTHALFPQPALPTAKSRNTISLD
jgi:hypothetical protein